jgi:hypothetical protein
VAVLTAVDYKEQEWLQVLMALVQLLLLLAIVGYCVIRSTGPDYTGLMLRDWRAIPAALGTVFFATSYHAAAPSVLAAGQNSATAQHCVALWVALSSSFIYAFAGSIGALLIPDLPDNVSLLFQSDSFGYATGQQPLALKVLVQLVILLPANDLATNSPMYGKALAGALTSALFSVDHQRVRRYHPLTFRLIRVMCVLPSLIFVLWTTRLVQAT